MQKLLFDKNDTCFMAKAIELSKSVKGKTGDNPAVGAVIYRAGKLISTGKTRRPSKDHAEKDAIKKAKSSLVGATMAVTLEPCCHTGRTGPCTTAIIKSGIKKVVVALKDPNPKVNGKGIRLLKKAGITVQTGLFKDEASEINEDFFHFIKTGKPLVTLKVALTLNGFLAANSGNSKWITSIESRKEAHKMRSNHDAILVGMETVRKDNPMLDVRHVKGRNPIRFILSTGNDIPLKADIGKSSDKIKTFLLTAKDIKNKKFSSVEYLTLSSKSGIINSETILKRLGKMGIKSLLIEGGSSIHTLFIADKNVDRFALFYGAKILQNGIPFINGKSTKSIKEALQLKEVTFTSLKNDFLVLGKI